MQVSPLFKENGRKGWGGITGAVVNQEEKRKGAQINIFKEPKYQSYTYGAMQVLGNVKVSTGTYRTYSTGTENNIIFVKK